MEVSILQILQDFDQEISKLGKNSLRFQRSIYTICFFRFRKIPLYISLNTSFLPVAGTFHEERGEALRASEYCYMHYK